MAFNKCADPRVRNNMQNIIQNAKTPLEAVQQLCNQYPNIAQQIDGAIGQGQNPRQMAMNLFNRK